MTAHLNAQRGIDAARRQGRQSIASRAKWTGVLLFFFFLALALRLRQRDFEFVVEPDFYWPLVETWRDFFATFDPQHLPRPTPHVYLDGQFILYGIVDGLLRIAATGLSVIRGYFPDKAAYALGSAMLTNIACYAAACTIFYAAMFRLTGGILISALMAAGLFFAPQMLDINIGRVDFLIMLPLMVIFFCSCVIAVGAERSRHALLLGVATGFAAVIKVNGMFFGIFPAMAVIATFRPDRASVRRLTRFTALSLVAFALTYLVLMGRFLYHLTIPEIAGFYAAAIEEVRIWAPLMGGPRWYYNIELMSGHGVWFIVLYLASAVAVLLVAIRYRSRPAIFLVLLFVVLSIAGAVAPKYERGGYHLLPVIFAMIGFAAAALRNPSIPAPFRVSGILIGGVIFAVSLSGSFERYQGVVAQRRSESTGIQLLKREPRDWLKSHVAPGTTICIQTASQWSLPPMDGFRLINGPLALPYLDAAALSKTYPSGLDEVRKDCPLIVISDYHRRIYGALLEQASPETAAKWKSFFAALDERYPPVVFSSPAAIYTQQVIINDLR